MMRLLLALVGVVALGWGGYWYLGSRAMEDALTGWLDARRAEGWQADAASVDTRGFPNRFDTTLTGVVIADPETGVAWTAPFFQILSLSYRPNHIIAVLPEAHSLATPVQTIELTSSQTTGSVIFRPDTRLLLERTNFIARDLGVQSTDGWAFAATQMQIATRPSTLETHAHQISVEAQNVDPGGRLGDLAGEAGLPDLIGTLVLDATVGFDAPWDRFAVERARPQPTLINLGNLKAEWGELLLQAAGQVEVDRDGVPTGAVSIRARNWKEMLNLAVASGAVPEGARDTVETALGFLAGLSGNPDHIDATLNFRGGFIAIGPLPIGPAPNLRIR